MILIVTAFSNVEELKTDKLVYTHGNAGKH